MGPESNQMLQRMLAFAAVAESGSFTKAAEKLGLAKSSVSKQIRALEIDFGVRLLHRESRKLVLTEEGRAIRPHCEQLVISSRLAVEDIEQLKGEAVGLLNVSAPPGIGEYLTKNFLPDFFAEHPGIILNLHISEQVRSVIDEEIDIALRVAAEEREDYVSIEIGKMHAQVYASPGYLKKNGMPQTVEDLSLHNCILLERGRGEFYQEWMLIKEGEGEKVNVKGNLVCNSIMNIREAAIRGLGLVFLPELVVEQEVHAGNLVPVLEEYYSQPLPICAVYSQRLYLPPKAKVFLQEFKKHFEQFLES